MKQTIKMSRAVGQIEKMYNVLNEEKFQNALPTPIITVQSKPGTYGHCSVNKVWKRADGETYEMNIAAEAANAPIEELIDTLIHEMIHLYCRENNIKEVSRGGKYHNGKFKELAEEKGLVCYKTNQYGWNTKGEGNDVLIEYAIEKGWSEIKINRETTYGHGRIQGSGATSTSGGIFIPIQRAPSSTRKLQCPNCKNSVRATKDVRIMCMDCMLQMVKV